MSGILLQCGKKAQHCSVSHVFITSNGQLQIVEVCVVHENMNLCTLAFVGSYIQKTDFTNRLVISIFSSLKSFKIYYERKFIHSHISRYNYGKITRFLHYEMIMGTEGITWETPHNEMLHLLIQSKA